MVERPSRRTRTDMEDDGRLKEGTNPLFFIPHLFFRPTILHSTKQQIKQNRAETRTQPNTTIKEARGWVFSCLVCWFCLDCSYTGSTKSGR